ncbi:hypothetical protein [Nonomuraea sp. B19D2]|uniref:hypothetical protein n=1 Tax=Nonomuraea sp. B19D2 TaxID=3159561 RepID=UPI0032DA579A
MASLTDRVDGIRKLADQANAELFRFHPWGMLGEIELRGDCTALMTEFSGLLDTMRKSLDDVGERLRNTSINYAEDDEALLRVLAAAAARKEVEPEAIRELNPASRFYRDHRLLNGIIEALPYPLGQLGMTALLGVRTYGDATSDDRFNLGSDIALLTQSAISTFFGLRTGPSTIRADPLGYLLNNGAKFLINAMYWVKWAVDWVTGDPIATGQAAYNFDSMATSLRGLARGFEQALDAAFKEGEWQGAVSEAARARLTAFHEGIAETGDLADKVAAKLQLASAIIGTVEGIIRETVNGLITWAVKNWFYASMLAGPTGGQSMVVAAREISAASADSASRVGAMIDNATALFRRLAVLMRRAIAALVDSKRRAFTLLQGSSWGQKNIQYPYGARYSLGIVRQDAGVADGVQLTWRHYAASFRRQARQLPLTNTLVSFGFVGYRADKHGKLYPDGKQRIGISMYSYTDRDGQTNAKTNYLAPPASTAVYALPFARSWQYNHRAGEVPPTGDIAAKLKM